MIFGLQNRWIINRVKTDSFVSISESMYDDDSGFNGIKFCPATFSLIKSKFLCQNPVSVTVKMFQMGELGGLFFIAIQGENKGVQFY